MGFGKTSEANNRPFLGMSRRDFMQFAIAAGMAPALASATFDNAVAQSTPRKGGKFRIAIGHGSTTDTLDPATYPGLFSAVALWGTASNGLTEIDADGNVVGDLAETIETSADLKKWVFKLHNGLTFHSGRPVEASDVIASIQHHRGETKSAAKQLLATVTSVKATTKNEVTFELQDGNADFSALLSDYHLPIMPANADGTADWQSGDRTGPYAITDFNPGVKATFKRNPNYHKEDRAHFDEVEAFAITDVTARTTALSGGDIDYMDRVDVRVVDRMKGDPNIQILETTGTGHYLFVMNVTEAPFNDPNVRQALKYSIDRDEIVKKVFSGHGVVGHDNPIAPNMKFASDPQPRHTYDPDKAREHLAKSGLTSLSINLSVADAAFTGAVDAATLWQAQAKAAGIEINLVREPNDAYWDNVWMKKPLCASYWSGRSTADWMFSTAYASDAKWNDSFWANSRFDELLKAARAELDETKRAAMYAEMQQIVHDDGGALVLMFNTFVDAHVKSLRHNKVAANWPMDGYKIAERWWFE